MFIQFCNNVLIQRGPLKYNILSSFQRRCGWQEFIFQVWVNISGSSYWPRPRYPPLPPLWCRPRPPIEKSSIAAVVGIPEYPGSKSAAAAAFLLPTIRKLIFLSSFPPAKFEQQDRSKAYSHEQQDHPELQICAKFQILSSPQSTSKAGQMQFEQMKSPTFTPCLCLLLRT